MSEDVEKVRARINIVDVVGRHVNLKKSGRGFTGLCPFHDDKNPSFSVNPTTGTYRCWSCGAKGDVFKFVMEMDRLSFREALETLAADAGVVLEKRSSDPDMAQRQRRDAIMQLAQDFFVQQLSNSKMARDYCATRGLSPEVLSDWGLGFGPEVGDPLANHLKKSGYTLQESQELFLVDKDSSGGYFDRFRSRLIFPIWDERGKLVAFGGRIIGNGIPKYINSSDTPIFSKRRTLYGMHRARNPMAQSGRAVLVEGYLDVIACHRAGVEEAVASLGTSLSDEHALLIKKWAKEVVVLYDADAAGQKAADRAEQILTAHGLKVRIALMPEGEDPDTLLRSAGPEAVRLAVDAGLTPTDFRMNQLRLRADPKSDEFWAEAYSILALATNPLEIEKYTTELAGLYPGIRDRVAAEKAIKREIMRYKRMGPRAESDAPVRATRVPRAPVHASEAILLLALLDKTLAPSAYKCLQEDLFFTGQGVEIQQSITEHFGDKFPATQAHQWIPTLPEVVQDVFAMLESKAIVALKSEVLADAIKALKEKKEERELQRLKTGVEPDDQGLKVIQERLERLKNKDS